MAEQKTSRGTMLAVVLAVLAVVVGLFVLQAVSDDDEPAAAPGDGGTEQVPTPPPGECLDPPALPESPESFDEVPDQGLAGGEVWTATLRTTCGDVVLELYGDKAPQTVSSFLFLARENYWDDSPCHRLVTQGIFVLQCGDPTGTGSGGPGYGYGVENAPPDGRYPRGSIAMARTSDPNTNGGQFFIVYDDTEIPDPTGYSIFGRVVEGMDVVNLVAAAGVGGTLAPEAPRQPISILDVTVQKKL